MKKRIVNSGIFYKNKITVVGSPRISYFCNLKPNKIEKKVKIVFFQYTKKRGNIINKNIKVRNIYDKPDISWNKTELACVKVLIELCKKYPNTLEVIFKIRENVYNAPNFLSSLKLPISENMYRNGLYLPSGLALKDDQIHYVCSILKEAFQSF